MKNSKYVKKIYLIAMFSLLFCQISCETTDNTNNSIDTTKPLANTFISKINSEKIVPSERMVTKIKRNADIPESEELIDFTLRKLEKTEKSDQDANQELYVLNAKTKDGKSSIAHIFRLDETKSKLIDMGKTCKCTSTNCRNGCDASIFGGNCQCSYCSSECKKESTVTEEELESGG